MKRFSFVLWMVLYPFGCSLIEILEQGYLHHVYSANDQTITALIEIGIWVGVGMLIWTDKETPNG